MKKSRFIMLMLIGFAVIVGFYQFNNVTLSGGPNLDNSSTEHLPLPPKTLTYRDKNDQVLVVTMHGTDMVEVQFDTAVSKPIIGFITRSASGTKYVSQDQQFTFWSKGHEATLFDHHDTILFDGTEVERTVK